MTRTRFSRLARAALAGLGLLTAALVLAGSQGLLPTATAGPKDAKKASASAHLNYRASYAEAMREARIRGVPILFIRHKDG